MEDDGRFPRSANLVSIFESVPWNWTLHGRASDLLLLQVLEDGDGLFSEKEVVKDGRSFGSVNSGALFAIW